MRVAFDSRPAEDHAASAATRAACSRRCASPTGARSIESHDPRRCDVFHSPWIDGALLRSPVPMVVTLHDLVPLKRRGEYLRSGLRFKLRYLAVQRAVRVIVPTKAVADDAVNVLDIPAERIVVIPEAAAPALGPRSADEVDAVRKRYELPEQYLLWVGGLRTPDPRKRVAALARAKRTLPLVLVGPTGRWARELTDVTLTGAVSDDELAAIYTRRPRARVPQRRRGLRAAADRGARVRHAGGGVRRPGAARGARRDGAAFGRGRRSRRPDRDRRVAAPARAAAGPAWTWGDAAVATWDVYARRGQRPAALARPASAQAAAASGRPPV